MQIARSSKSSHGKPNHTHLVKRKTQPMEDDLKNEANKTQKKNNAHTLDTERNAKKGSLAMIITSVKGLSRKRCRKKAVIKHICQKVKKSENELRPNAE